MISTCPAPFIRIQMHCRRTESNTDDLFGRCRYSMNLSRLAMAAGCPVRGFNAPPIGRPGFRDYFRERHPYCRARYCDCWRKHDSTDLLQYLWSCRSDTGRAIRGILAKPFSDFSASSSGCCTKVPLVDCSKVNSCRYLSTGSSHEDGRSFVDMLERAGAAVSGADSRVVSRSLSRREAVRLF